MSKTHYIVVAAILGLLVIIFVTPEFKKEGEAKELLKYDIDQISYVQYQGKMQYEAFGDVFVNFKLTPIPDQNVQDGYLWKISILQLKPLPEGSSSETDEDSRLSKSQKKKMAAAAKKKLKKLTKSLLLNASEFWGNHIMKSMVDDLRKLSYQYVIADEQKKRKEYGFANCRNMLTVAAKNETHNYCVGLANYGKSRRYIWQKGSENVYLIHNYIASRFEKEIFKYRDSKLLPFKLDKPTRITIILRQKLKKKYPVLFKKTGGIIEMKSSPGKRLNKNSPEPPPVWNIDKLSPFDSNSFCRNIKVQIFNFKLNAFVKSEPNDLPQPYLAAEFFGKKDNTEVRLGKLTIYDFPYKKNWKIKKTSTVLNQEDALALSDYQSGIYPIVNKVSFLEQLNRLELALYRYEAEKKAARDEEKKKQEKKKLKAPERKDK